MFIWHVTSVGQIRAHACSDIHSTSCLHCLSSHFGEPCQKGGLTTSLGGNYSKGGPSRLAHKLLSKYTIALCPRRQACESTHTVLLENNHIESNGSDATMYCPLVYKWCHARCHDAALDKGCQQHGLAIGVQDSAAAGQRPSCPSCPCRCVPKECL